MIILDTVQINAIYERLHGLVNGTKRQPGHLQVLGQLHQERKVIDFT